MHSNSPVFISGSIRSGTTLAADLIGLHSLISPIYEPDFASTLADLIRQRPNLPLEKLCKKIHKLMDAWSDLFIAYPSNKRKYETYFHGDNYLLFEKPFIMQSTAQLIAALQATAIHPDNIARKLQQKLISEFITLLFNKHAKTDGKPYWICKHPGFMLSLEQLLTWFPNMKFINCIRDPRAVALSRISLAQQTTEVKSVLDIWNYCIDVGLAFAKRFPDRYFALRYEDFILQPQITLQKLFAWLEVNDESDKIMQELLEQNYQFNPERINSWQQHMSAADQQHVINISEHHMQRYGYV